MQENDFVVLSAYSCRWGAGNSLLVGHSLDTNVNLVFAGDGSRLIVTDVAVKSFEFRVVAVYVLNSAGERRSFIRRLETFVEDPRRLVLVADWNVILDPKLGRVVRGASGSD